MGKHHKSTKKYVLRQSDRTPECGWIYFHKNSLIATSNIENAKVWVTYGGACAARDRHNQGWELFQI